MSAKSVIATIVAGITGETGGKMFFEFLKSHIFSPFSEKALEKKYAQKKMMEDGRSRLLHALADLFDPKNGVNKVGNLLHYHELATNKMLFDLKGKPIKENRFVYFLTQLDPNRLESTLIWLNNLPEEKFQQMLTVMDEDQLGDNWFEIKKFFKEIAPLLIQFLALTGLLNRRDLGSKAKSLSKKISEASNRAKKDAMDSQKRLEEVLNSKRVKLGFWR